MSDLNVRYFMRSDLSNRAILLRYETCYRDHKELPAAQKFILFDSHMDSHSQSSTVVTYGVLVATRFTRPRKDGFLSRLACHSNPGFVRRSQQSYTIGL